MKRPGIVHRIDKETTGLLVAAKSDRAHHGLAKQFADHSVERRYLALCYGEPSSNDPRLRGIKGASFEASNILRVQTFLGRHKTDRQRQAVSFTTGRHAVTRARIVESLGTPAVAALLECWLETGRTHQIRVHTHSTGHPLIGDPVYSGTPQKTNLEIAQLLMEFPRQALHAQRLVLTHPKTQQPIQWVTKLPEDMEVLLLALRKISRQEG